MTWFLCGSSSVRPTVCQKPLRGDGNCADMKTSLPATITKVTTMRDLTVRIQLDCQEMLPEYMAEIFSLNNKLGWFFFHEAPIKEIDTSKLPEIHFEEWEKTPGQRMRAVLYRLYERTDKKITFEQFYKEKMEQLIEMLKEKLN